MCHLHIYLPHIRFKLITPCAIKVGDIVEVQMFVLVAPIKNHKFKMTVKLCGIAILSTEYTDVSTSEQCFVNLEYSHHGRKRTLAEQWLPLKNLRG